MHNNYKTLVINSCFSTIRLNEQFQLCFHLSLVQGYQLYIIKYNI